MSFRACPYFFEKSDFMLGKYLEKVRENAPIIHNITNYVTVNDVANIILACGASPIRSDEPEDAAEITGLCGGININIGTLNKRTISGMFSAGKRARGAVPRSCARPCGGGSLKASHRHGRRAFERA